MALEASLRELADRLSGAREAFVDLRVAAVEDTPEGEAPLFCDRLGDAAGDLQGWLEEAVAAAGQGLDKAERPRDLEGVQEALLLCHERALRVAGRFAADAFNCERLRELCEIGARRGRAWRLWSASVERALAACQQGLITADSALLGCWRELAELTGAPALRVRA